MFFFIWNIDCKGSSSNDLKKWNAIRKTLVLVRELFLIKNVEWLRITNYKPFNVNVQKIICLFTVYHQYACAWCIPLFLVHLWMVHNYWKQFHDNVSSMIDPRRKKLKLIESDLKIYRVSCSLSNTFQRGVLWEDIVNQNSTSASQSRCHKSSKEFQLSPAANQVLPKSLRLLLEVIQSSDNFEVDVDTSLLPH